jgi:hypothetical protein
MNAVVLISVIGVVAFVAALFAAHRNVLPVTIPWWVALATASFVVCYALGIATPWGWLIVGVLVLSLIACMLHIILGSVFLASSLVIVIAIAGLTGLQGQPPQTPTALASTPAKTNVVPASNTTTTCDARFVQAPLDRGTQSRYIVDGVVTLKLDANTPAIEKRDAYLAAAGHDVVLLGIYAYASGLWADPNNTEPLVSDACLSPKGQEVYTMLIGAWTANGSNAANAPTPADGTNSGIDGGKMVIAATAGMRNGRTGILITLANGSSVFVDDLCGNVIFRGTPVNVPKGPTDQPTPVASAPPANTPPTVVPPKVCPPTMPYGTWPVCKGAPSGDPAARGTAPTGSGTSIDPGPGAYVPPAQMAPAPAAPYVAPAAPAPAPAAAAPKPDPAPAPAPEAAAPAAPAPAAGTSCAPGITTC